MTGVIEGFFGVTWFKYRFFWVLKTNDSIFCLLHHNVFWTFLGLGNSAWDFFGGTGGRGKFWFRDFFGFWFLPPFDRPYHLKSGVPPRWLTVPSDPWRLQYIRNFCSWVTRKSVLALQCSTSWVMNTYTVGAVKFVGFILTHERWTLHKCCKGGKSPANLCWKSPLIQLDSYMKYFIHIFIFESQYSWHEICKFWYIL